MNRICTLSLLFLFLFAASLHAQMYHCEIKNINQPNNTTIDFDVYIYNTSTNTLYFGGFQGGINFNYAGLANGGIITGGFLPGSSYDPATAAQLPFPMNAPNWNINSSTNQIRMLASIVTSQAAAAVIPTAAPGIRIGTFRMTNTVPFSACTKPNFEWSFVTGSNITKTAIIGWVNSSPTQSAFTVQTTFDYNNQGPEHYVESNPNINPTSILTNFIMLACMSYTWNGNTYTSSGTYTDTLVSANGCDSVLILDLVIDQPTFTTQNVTACDQYTWIVDGQTYTTSGTYQFVTIMPSGCAHTDILNLTIGTSTSTVQAVTACDFYTWPANNQSYVGSGTYMHIGTNTSGCPDTSILLLTIKSSNSNYDTINTCAPITWNGQSLNASGNYVYVTTNASGCDSTVYLNFNLAPPINDTTTLYHCGPYTVAGNTYTTSGTYSYQTISAFGCVDNHLLYLTIGQNSYNTTVISGCGSVYFNNTLFSTNGFYTTIMPNAVGCDSIITLSVTINQPVTQSQYITTCDSYTLGGITYTTSGVYTILDTTSAGCDSTTILYLTIKNSSRSYVTQTAINSYTWSVNGITYFNTGVYTYTGINSVGCSSFDTLDLTIEYPLSISDLESEINLQAVLYPNPANDNITLEWKENKAGELLHFNVLDLSGRKVIALEYQTIPGLNRVEFPLQTLASGVYQIEAITSSSQSRFRSRFVKQQ